MWFPVFGNYKSFCTNKSVYFCRFGCFFLGYLSRSRIFRSYVNSMFNFLRNWQYFPKQLHNLYSHEQYMIILILHCIGNFLVFLITLKLRKVKWYFIVIFDMNFPKILRSFHILSGHLCIFFGKMPIPIICYIFNWVRYLCIVRF